MKIKKNLTLSNIVLLCTRAIVLPMIMKDSKNIVMKGCTFPVQYTEARINISDAVIRCINTVLIEKENQMKQGNKEILIDDLSIVFTTSFLSNLNATPKIIYAGMNCKSEHITNLIQIAHELNVPLYQMKIDNDSVNYELVPMLIIG